MDLTPYVDELQHQLAAAAAAGSDEVQQAAARLAGSLDSAARLVLLDALSTAAGEISRELLPGSVDVRLRGRDPQFVVERPPVPLPAQAVSSSGGGPPDAQMPPGPPPPGDDGPAARTTLRLPDGVKARIEAAAAREGLSLNSWIVRALTAAVDAPSRAAPARPNEAQPNLAQPNGAQPNGTQVPGGTQRSSSFSGWVR